MNKELTFRLATRKDVKTIVQMLADDPLGETREQFQEPLPESYFSAFEAIERDKNNELIVACKREEVVGVMQLTYIPYLTYQGGWRALIEGVFVSSKHRGRGIGHVMFEWAIQRAKERGCHLLQLTTDKRRSDAKKFYESLGFKGTHEGMKLHFDP